MIRFVNVSITDTESIREIAGDPRFTSVELFKSEPAGHKFTPGDTAKLIGLVEFPEYNGDLVKITAIRQNGPHGKAYYIEGRINAMLNWTYEYRLALTPQKSEVRGRP